MDTTKKSVLEYLKKKKLQNRESFDRLILFGVKPNDIIKYIERPDDCGRWPFDFVCQVHNAVQKISKKYLIDAPVFSIGYKLFIAWMEDKPEVDQFRVNDAVDIELQ